MTDINLQLPPSYIEPNSASTFLLDIFDSPFGLPCVCGDQTGTNDLHAVRPYIIRMCQMSDNPCYVEIDFHLGTAQGIYKFNPNLSGYSTDTTNGQDGTWFQLRPDLGNNIHNPSPNNISLSGSESVDATWAYGLYNSMNSTFINNDPCIADYISLGIPVHKFVFDMCTHIDTWMSEPSVAFRLTFDKVVKEIQLDRPCIVKYI